MSKRRPNILFIQTDQLSAFALPAYGNGYCKSPNIDRLAAEGAVFETAYCNYPLCAPSRFSMASGLLPSRIGAYDNGSEFPSSIPTYAHYLRDLGYRTCLSGKMHFVGPDQLHGFEERLTPDIYPSDFSWSADWSDADRSDPNDDRALRISGPCEGTVQIDYDTLVKNEAISALHRFAGDSDDDRPFFLQVSFTHPHDPFLCLGEHWARYEGMDVPPPAVGRLGEAETDAHSRRLLELVGMFGKDYPAEWIARARRAYFGSISFVDDMVGELLSALEETGAGDSTFIVFTSDHGEMLGERGMWFKRTFFEPAMRVPLILHAPFLFGPCRARTVATLLDIVPTLADVASGGEWEAPAGALDGGSLLPYLADPELATVRPARAEYLGEMTPGPMLMTRRGRYKFIWNGHDPDLLFDMEADPHELNNIAQLPEMERVVAIFRRVTSEDWSAEKLTEDVIRSQKRRLLVESAHRKGQSPGWDYGERPGEKVPWYRGQEGYNEWAFRHVAAADRDN